MPEESNIPKTLHQLVSSRDTTHDKAGNQLKLVGYSISSYAGVLSALEKAKIIQNETNTSDSSLTTSGGTPFGNVTSRSWTYLSNYGIGNENVIQDDFYQSDLNQARVLLKDYMPFVLDCTTDNGTIQRACVGRRDYTHLSLLHQGISISSSQNPQFPPGEWSQDNLTRCKNGIASSDNGEGFVIGLGVAFNQLVIKYFNHFYPNMGWSEQNLKVLAAKGYLCGELMVPKGNNAKVLHSKITVDISQSNTSPYAVFVPVPLMLIDDFKELGYVRVKNNTTEENVDGNKLKFPFSNKKFNHKKCEIEGFTPDAVTDYVTGSNTRHVEYIHTGLNGGGEVHGRMRFYFLPESQQEVAAIIGAIPDEYKDKLFRGVISEDGYYKSESAVSFDDSPVEVGIFSNSVYYPDALRDIISEQHYAKALAIIRCAEIGTPTTAPGSCEWNVANDGAGITYGNYQTTGKSGGLQRLIEYYVTDSKSMKTYVDMINTYKSYAGEYGRKSASSGVRSLMDALKQAGNNDPNMAICQSRHVYEEQIKAKGLINAFKNSGCKSPLAFAIALHCYNQGRPRNFWSGIASASDEKTKCILMIQNELAFLRRMSWWPNPATEKTSNHIRWTNDYMKAANNGNFNLNQVQRWCNARF